MTKGIGSKTAKAGFKNEDFVKNQFNNWKQSDLAQQWLIGMGYDIKEIESVLAIRLSGHKTDVQIKVIIVTTQATDFQNLQVKLISNENGYNQIDKRWINKYLEMWDIPENIVTILKEFTGEKKHSRKNTSNVNRIFLSELDVSEKKEIINFFTENKLLIIADILKGRGKFSAEWLLVIHRDKKIKKYCIKPMNKVMSFFGNGNIIITSRGSLKIGKITMQRKGGDSGADTAKMLQFKINPALAFEIN